MPRTVLLVGTRKGCSCWRATPTAATGGARPVLRGLADLPRGARPRLGRDLRRRRERVARRRPSGAAPTSARRGSSRARASATASDEAEALEGLGPAAAHGRVLAGAEAAGIFESRDGGATWSLLSTLDGQPGSEGWNDPANQPPGHLGLSATLPHPDDPARFWAIVQGFGHLRDDRRRRVVDAAQQRAARRLAARSTRRSASASTSSCMSPVDHEPPLPAEPRRHAPQRRRRPLLDRDHGGPADRVRLRRRGAPARPRHLLRDPARPGPRALHARRPGGGLAHARRRLDLAAARPRAAAATTRTSACCARGWRSTRTTCPASTSARARARCSRAPTRARAGARSRATCRRSRRSRSRRSGSAWPTLHLPPTLPPLFARPAAPASTSTRRRSTRRSTGSTSAGPACATGSASRARRCAATSTSTSTASAPGSTRALGARSRVDVIAAISGG